MSNWKYHTRVYSDNEIDAVLKDLEAKGFEAKVNPDFNGYTIVKRKKE